MQGKEGCCWAADPQQRAESCAEREDSGGPLRRAAGVRSLVRTWWEASDAKQGPGAVGSVQAVVPKAAGASLEPQRGNTSHWLEQVAAPGGGRPFVTAAGACWVEDAVLDVVDAAGVLHLGAAEAWCSSAGGPEDQGSLVVVASKYASLDGRAGWEQVYSFVAR